MNYAINLNVACSSVSRRLTTARTRPRIARLSSARPAANYVECAAGDVGRWVTSLLMTLQEVIDSLPNGLHDTQVHSINLDYVKREAKLILNVWIGSMYSEEESRETYRYGELKLSGLLYWIAEPPDPAYPYGEPNGLCIDAGCPASSNPHLSAKLPEPLPEGVFTCWIYVNNWNAFIYAAAMNASFEWV